MPFGLGIGETILIFTVFLLFFGPKRLPELGGALGKGMRDFRRALAGLEEDATSPVRSVATSPLPEGALDPAAPAAKPAPAESPQG